MQDSSGDGKMHMTGAHKGKVPILLYLATFLLSPLPTLAQSPCPFDSTEAVVDTLTFSGYHPLAVGNVWEYTREVGAFDEDPFQITVVGDSVVDGKQYLAMQRVSYHLDSPIVTADTLHYFEHVNDTSIIQLFGQNEVVNDIRLSAAFNSCYPGFGSTVEVRGEYAQFVTFEENSGDSTYAVDALKELRTPESEETFAHSIGRIRIEGDPNVITKLVYAKIGQQEYGTRLDSLFDIRVNIDSPFRFSEIALEVFPNPASSAATVRPVASPSASHVKIEVIDVLGRVTKVVYKGNLVAMGTALQFNTREFSSGYYLIVLTTTDGQRISKPFVVVH